jgi:hypothetical protein
MRLIKAKLVKNSSADSLAGVNALLGKEYTVDLDSVSTQRLFNKAHGKFHEKELISTYNEEGVYSGDLPVELLEFQGAS